jgi:hypothetical protein
LGVVSSNAVTLNVECTQIALSISGVTEVFWPLYVKKLKLKNGGLKNDPLKACFLDWAARYADYLDPSGNSATSDWADDG